MARQLSPAAARDHVYESQWWTELPHHVDEDEEFDRALSQGIAVTDGAEADVWSDESFLPDTDSFNHRESSPACVGVLALACLEPPSVEQSTATPRSSKAPRSRKTLIESNPPRESRRGALWLGVSLVVAFFCLFQALPRWSANDGLSLTRVDQAVTLDSLDTKLAGDYRVGDESYNFFNIEDIRPGQYVLAMNPATGQLEPKRVKQIFRRITDHLRHLTFESSTGARQTFETTDEHPFWSQSEFRWRPAGDLQPGDRVIDPHGAQSLLIATHREPHPEGVPVYNFEVQGFHSYFVAGKGPGGEPVLVHNADSTYKTSGKQTGTDSQSPARINVGPSGHHLPAVRKSQGRPFAVVRSDKTRPTVFSRGNDPAADHWRLHNAERKFVGPRQGAFGGTDDELFEAYRRAYSNLDDIRVDVRSPNGTYNLGEDVSPREAVDLIRKWLREQGLL